MEQAFIIFTAPTVILLLVVFFILHDKMINRRERKKGQGKNYAPSGKTDLNITKSVVEQLPETASFEQIMTSIQQAWCRQIPGPILAQAQTIFPAEKVAMNWLTTRQEQLNQGIPVELCRIPGGEEFVLQVLRDLAAQKSNNW